MQMVLLLIVIASIIWIMSLKRAESIGEFFIKHVINPIKDLLE